MRGVIMASGLFLASAVPLQAAPGDMSVATFLSKADSLKKKGPLALLSGDIKLLKGEIEGSAAGYKTKLQADKAAGRSPHSCPPSGTKLSLNSDELMRHYQSYPAAQRSSTTVRQGFYDLMRKRFPCP